MLGRLKNKISDSAIQGAINKFSSEIEIEFRKITNMTVVDVQSDEHFKSKIVMPALLAASAASSGSTKLIPKFDVKFTNALFNVRNKLIKYDAANVCLAEDFERRLPEVLMEGFKE